MADPGPTQRTQTDPERPFAEWLLSDNSELEGDYV